MFTKAADSERVAGLREHGLFLCRLARSSPIGTVPCLVPPVGSAEEVGDGANQIYTRYISSENLREVSPPEVDQSQRFVGTKTL